MGKTWVLVADRVRARLFELESGNAALNEVEAFVNPEGRDPAGSRGDMRPTRSIESVGGARHAIEPHTTPETKYAERFARRLHDALEQGRVQHRYDQLVLVAPPRFLGALHGALGKNVRSHVVAEVRRNLTAMTPEQIRVHIGERALR
ncbi:protein required for attachment to host cells [Mizugakiibacter sediminis]|uniref:Protein required for attachment to host cells n=1 Tax=Mizugakiibacter sediminis TaxID=1475481 RepID=A0A0K8QQE8_9GAMM|nr:host attachment protein [Mizugakiibacter sediminis]GAP66936.1 protein required for attachment to host cells [Mizugakiibacter sediminis]